MHSVNTDNSRDTDKVPENRLEPSFVPKPGWNGCMHVLVHALPSKGCKRI